MCSNVSSFYDETEIVEAKNCLFTWINSANLGFDDVPRNKPRKTGDNKRKHDTDDIIALFEYLDYKKVLLPVFVAKKLSQLPAVKPCNVDLYKLTGNVQIMEMQNVLKSVSDNQVGLANNTVSTIACTVASVSMDDISACNNEQKVQPHRYASVRINSQSQGVTEPDNDDQSGEGNVDPNGLSKSFAHIFGNTDDGDDWFTVQPSTRPPKKMQ